MKRSKVNTTWTARVEWRGKRTDGLWVIIEADLSSRECGEEYAWRLLRPGGSEIRNGCAPSLLGAKVAAARAAGAPEAIEAVKDAARANRGRARPMTAAR